MKLKPNRLLKDKPCQTCENFTTPDCPKTQMMKSISFNIEKYLVGMTVIEKPTEITIIDCPKYKRGKFLSDYFPFLDKV